MSNTESTWHLYESRPSLIAAAIFAALFLLTSTVHLYQRAKSHSRFMNPFIVGGVFQIIGYCARGAAHYKQTSTTIYAIQTLLLLLSPILYAASIYMILGRLIISLKAQLLSLIPVKWLTKIFVCGDILPFVLQGAGGGIMSSGSASNLKTGQWVIVGLCVQLVFFGAFLLASIIFNIRIISAPTVESDKGTHCEGGRRCWSYNWQGLLYTCYLVSVLILARSIYRVVEFAQGNTGYVISNEWFLYVFDACMMVCVMVLLNVFHPAGILSHLTHDGHHRAGSGESVLDYPMRRMPEGRV
ncbi:RTA1 domain-containing protein [Aspergillus stella-maris]|uniref:RTA1 domain-containing protein n=1 Tax=Aspergillus stella-maris TaxID=1810926 RepID=UPI003CCDA830